MACPPEIAAAAPPAHPNILELLRRYVETRDVAALVEGFKAHNSEVVACERNAAESARVIPRVEAIEEYVRTHPDSIAIDPEGFATLRGVPEVGDIPAGRFRVMSVGELRAAAAARRAEDGVLGAVPRANRLFVLDGVAPCLDVGAMQAFIGAENVTFQVASQFNALESPSPKIVEVAQYFHDPTQGPRAAVGCFQGALLRHYAGPTFPPRAAAVDDTPPDDGEGSRVNLLARVCEEGEVVHGYLRGAQIEHPERLIRTLTERADDVCVGVHDGLQVHLGYNFKGRVPASPAGGLPTCAQVLTSTLARGMQYGGDSNLTVPQEIELSRRLLGAAYAGTLNAAVAVGSSAVVLTLIGGGVFENHIGDIWAAILAAFRALPPSGLDVVVNGRALTTHSCVEWGPSGRVGFEAVATHAAAYGGAFFAATKTGITPYFSGSPAPGTEE